MATIKTDAQKVAEYRAIAMDKTKPQEVRDQADMKANDIEKKAAGAAGVKLAKGGVVAKAGAKKAPMKAAGKAPALVIAVGVGKPKGKTMMNKGGMAKKGKC
jgi:hypothetical protein